MKINWLYVGVIAFVFVIAIIANISIAGFLFTPNECKNETIIQEKVVLREIEKDCPKNNCPKCPEAKECVETDAQKKLTMCNIRLDVINDEYFKCLQHNDTDYLEDLRYNFTECKEDLLRCNHRINNITEWIK